MATPISGTAFSVYLPSLCLVLVLYLVYIYIYIYIYYNGLHLYNYAVIKVDDPLHLVLLTLNYELAPYRLITYPPILIINFNCPPVTSTQSPTAAVA